MVTNHQLPTGQDACFKVDFNLMKQPHFLHLASLLLKNGHVLHILRRYSIKSLSDRSCLGSNRSENSTSPLSFIIIQV